MMGSDGGPLGGGVCGVGPVEEGRMGRRKDKEGVG